MRRALLQGSEASSGVRDELWGNSTSVGRGGIGGLVHFMVRHFRGVWWLELLYAMVMIPKKNCGRGMLSIPQNVACSTCPELKQLHLQM